MGIVGEGAHRLCSFKRDRAKNNSGLNMAPCIYLIFSPFFIFFPYFFLHKITLIAPDMMLIV